MSGARGRRPGGVPAGLILGLTLSAAVLPTPTPAAEGRGPTVPVLSGRADWEFFRSEGESSGTRAVFDVLRQRYSMDLSGSLWDPRFNRYNVGIDWFRHDRKVDGRSWDSQTFGYRAITTFFPARPFPLRLYARRAATDAPTLGLAESDRESSAWGAEWNLLAGGKQRGRVLYDRSAFDLLAPVALRERRRTALAEYAYRFDGRETTVRFTHSGQKEMVHDTDFLRRQLAVTDRTRFENGNTLLLNGSHTLSDARFTTGVRDDLTTSRLHGVLDLPRRRRVGFNLSYDFNDQRGRFVDSVGHLARGIVRARVNGHWEPQGGVTLGRIQSRAPAAMITQEIGGVSAGVRYNRDWRRLRLTSGLDLGLNETRFDGAPDRTLTTRSLDVDLRVPLRGALELYAAARRAEDENDTTGVGYTFDETRFDLGLDGRPSASVRVRGSVYWRDTRNDTFQFGIQDSEETGVSGSLAHPRGGVTVTFSSREGISDFVPDPGLTASPFLPGNDLVSRADRATVGAHVRLPHRLRVGMQARMEDREFTSIGKERIVSWRPEVEWSSHAWRFALTFAHYRRDNDTSFRQDTLLLTVKRRFF